MAWLLGAVQVGTGVQSGPKRGHLRPKPDDFAASAKGATAGKSRDQADVLARYPARRDGATPSIPAPLRDDERGCFGFETLCIAGKCCGCNVLSGEIFPTVHGGQRALL